MNGDAHSITPKTPKMPSRNNLLSMAPAGLFKEAVLTLTFFVVGVLLWGGLLSALVVFGYVALVGYTNKPALELFYSREASEWLLGLAFSRRALAVRYVYVLLLRSTMHTVAAVTVLSAFVMPHLENGDVDFANGNPRAVFSWLAWSALFFAGHVTFQGAIAIIRHLEYCTWIPARWRDLFLGNRTLGLPALLGVFLWPAIVATILVLPVLLCVQLGSASWIVLPAAAYLAATFGMVASSEAATRKNPDLSVLIPRASAEAIYLGQPLRLAPHRFTPQRALCWNGLKPWVRHFLWLGPLSGAIVAAVWVLILPRTEFGRPGVEETWLLFKGGVAFGIGSTLFLYLLAYSVFEWQSTGPTAEYLFIRGVSLGTLRRTNLLTGLLITGLVFAYAFLNLWIFGRLDLLNNLGQHYWGLLLIPTGLILLQVNEAPIGLRAVRARHLAALLRVTLPILFCGAFFLAVMVTEARFVFEAAPLWNSIGLAVFVPALVLWIRAWKHSSNEQKLRWDTWEA